MTSATCTEEAKCKAEGCTYTEKALGHSYQDIVTKPTCLEKGYTTHTCIRCEDNYVDSYIDELGHSFTEYISNDDATCTQDGTKTAHCDRCDQTDTVIDEGSMLGHTEEIIEGKEATCLEAGLTEGKYCLICRTTLIEQEEIPVLGHNYEDTII